ncbi:collagenase [Kitasatospora sp. NPDC004240]
MSAIAVALPLAVGLMAPQSQAAPVAPTQPATSPTPVKAAPRAIPLPKSPDTPKDSRPLASELDAERSKAPQAALTVTGKGTSTGTSTGTSKSAKNLQAAPSAADESCQVSAFVNKTGGALLQQVKSVTVDCLNTMYPLMGADAQNIFAESKMVTVADELKRTATTYPGDNSTSAGQLVQFLRVGYYVQWTNRATMPAYGAALKSSVRGALDTFFAAPHAYDANDVNGRTLAESITLIDSAYENARYVGVAKRMFNDFRPTWPNNMWWATNSAVDLFERAFGDDDKEPAFVAALAADPGVSASMAKLVRDNGSIITGGDTATDTGIQLGAFLAHDALKAQARPLVKELINRYPLVGATGPLTMNLAWFAEKKDQNNCSYYGICDLPTRLPPLVLTVDHSCNAKLRIRAQQMSATELADTCTSLINQDAYFHQVIKDPGAIPGDLNTNLEVVVFDAYYDYSLYAWAMYGIDVDNGGMYEEGNPTQAGNQARFIAHEATWLRPKFEVWNLNHEYTHYLDGRYNMYGDFNAGMTTPTIWWVEGIAEYISYGYRQERDAKAIEQAALKTYKLSELFDTTYENSADKDVQSTRVYAWGYLAVRYMLQSHPQDLNTVLAKYRAGDWAGARTFLKNTIGTTYDADFANWLTACAADNCGTLPPAQAPLCTNADARQFDQDCRRDNLAATTGNYSYHFLYLPAGVKELTITSTGGTGNADLYYNGGNWATTGSYQAKSTNSGNGETLTIANPPAGWVYFSLHAQQGFSGASVSTKYTTAA